MQLTEVKNEEHTVTVAILHDLSTNIVQHLDFPKRSSTQQQERETWAVKARNCFHNTLLRIQKGISQKGKKMLETKNLKVDFLLDH